MPESYFPLVRREPTLVGYWRLNDVAGAVDATDYASRFELTGIYTSRSVGPSIIQNDTSSLSSSLGASGSMSVSDVAQLRILGDISLEAWISVYSASATVNIMSKQNSAGTTAGPYALELVDGSLSFSLGRGTSQTVLTAGVVPASLPAHVCATSFRGVMTIYINGAPVDSASLGSQVVADSGQSMIVGNTSTEDGADLISEVAIYNGALSARRVARHFAIGAQVLSNPSHYLTVDPPTIAI